MTHPEATGRALPLAVAIPLAALAAAFGSEAFGGLVPCEMCWWQRWAHVAALAFSLAALALRAASRHGGRIRGRAVPALVALAAVLVAASGVIGVAHLGVERHWWAGFTACTAAMPRGLTPAQALDVLIAMPVVRCDVPQWSLAGLSMAGWNAVLSLGGAVAIAVLLVRERRAR